MAMRDYCNCVSADLLHAARHWVMSRSGLHRRTSVVVGADLCRSEQFSERYPTVNSVLWRRTTCCRTTLCLASHAVCYSAMRRLLVVHSSASHVVLHTTWSCLWRPMALAAAATGPTCLVITMMTIMMIAVSVCVQTAGTCHILECILLVLHHNQMRQEHFSYWRWICISAWLSECSLTMNV